MDRLKSVFASIARLEGMISNFREKDDLPEAVRMVAKMMGVDEDDIIKYGGDSVSPSIYSQGNDLSQATLKVAKMFGHTPEDIIKYGN